MSMWPTSACPRTLVAALVLSAGVLAPGPMARAVEESAAARVEIPRAIVAHDDGDSFAIAWPRGREEVRILGIDAPEVKHVEHGIPYSQPYGERAAGFLEGAVAVASKIELLRSGETDPFGRTLGYLFLDGRNYSVLILRSHLAVETVSHYGDNGLPEPARRCVEAAREAGPVPFLLPHVYRARMRELVERQAARGGSPRPCPTNGALR